MTELSDTQKVVNVITDFVNSMSMNPKEFIAHMENEHRTLQQSFTRLVLQWLEHCATDKYRFDGRNEDTHRISKELVDAFSKLKEEQMPHHWVGVKPSQFISMV